MFYSRHDAENLHFRKFMFTFWIFTWRDYFQRGFEFSPLRLKSIHNKNQLRINCKIHRYNIHKGRVNFKKSKLVTFSWTFNAMDLLSPLLLRCHNLRENKSQPSPQPRADFKKVIFKIFFITAYIHIWKKVTLS